MRVLITPKMMHRKDAQCNWRNHVKFTPKKFWVFQQKLNPWPSKEDSKFFLSKFKSILHVRMLLHSFLIISFTLLIFYLEFSYVAVKPLTFSNKLVEEKNQEVESWRVQNDSLWAHKRWWRGKIGKRGIEWEIHRVAFVFPDPMGVCLKSLA